MSGYWLSLPFRFSSGLLLSDLENEAAVMLEGRVAVVRYHGRRPRDLLLQAKELDSPDEGLELFHKLGRALFWASLELDCGVLAVPTMQGVRIEYDPRLPPPNSDEEGVDPGTIWPQPGSTLRIMAGSPRKKPITVDRFVSAITAGMQLPEIMSTDPRIARAAQFLMDSYFLAHPESRFVSLVTVLEVLKDKGKLEDEVCSEVDVFAAHMKALAESHDKQGQWAEEAIEPLLSAVARLKEMSIGAGIRSMVRRHLGGEAARLAINLYRYRSILVHSGEAPDINRRIIEAQDLVRHLMARVVQYGV
jgi:hypothetical protein